MKKRILILGVVLALLAVLATPMTVSAIETTEVSGTVAAPVLTVTAPGAVDLGVIAYVGTAQQYVASGTDGNVAVTDLAGKSFNATVTGSSTKLVGATVLTNVLLIATGQDDTELGDVSVAAGLSSGSYVDPTTTFVAVTGSSQEIGTGLTSTPLALKLTVFQKIEINENLTSGSYTLTLTYAGTVTN